MGWRGVVAAGRAAVERGPLERFSPSALFSS